MLHCNANINIINIFETLLLQIVTIFINIIIIINGMHIHNINIDATIDTNIKQWIQ